MHFFLTLEKVVNVLIKDIHVSSSKPADQTNNKKFMDSNGIDNSIET